MNVERYLANFEANCSLTEVQPPPPRVSSFYWKNDAGQKYKVFTPTPNRYVYYNLEEYPGDIDPSLIETYGWTQVNKCVLLSLTDTNPEDQPFINFMENLITNLGTWHQTNTSNIYHQIFERGERLIDNDLDKFYRVTKYFVNEIIHIPQEERCRRTRYRYDLKVHYDHDVANIMHTMNIGFELAAQRFANDRNHGVLAYSRQI